MKIGIYNAIPSCLGGAGQSVAVLAEGLGQLHQVHILHHNPTLTAERLAEFSGTELSSVHVRYVDTHDRELDYQGFRRWGTAISEPYDVFVVFTHWLPPLCGARKGVLSVLFPSASTYSFYRVLNDLANDPLRPVAARTYWIEVCQVKGASSHDQQVQTNTIWREHLDSYQRKRANSRYTQAWTKRRWGVETEVIHSPVETRLRAVAKTNTILSVGRFLADGRSKKQLEMMTAFTEMNEASLQGWSYLSVGELSHSPEDHDYFEAVRRLGEAHQGHALANVTRAHLSQHYEEAKLFWHACGYGEDDATSPELTEHFGAATAEALAAGSVPIVINKGGQSEIVEHGVTGFLWNTLEELKHYTALLARDESLRASMSAAARNQARRFSREEYVNRFLKLIESIPM